MKKYLYILIFLFTANFAFATNVTVNTNSALVNAVNGTADTIFINGTIGTAAGDYEINITRKLVFIGINNGTLDGNNMRHFFYIYTSYSGTTLISVTFENLTFRNCKYNYGNGGAIVINRINTLRFKNCKFLNNTATWGGAIYGHDMQNLFFEKCEFRNNHASQVGGAVWVGGPSENSSGNQLQGNLFLTYCIFDNNSAEMGTGALDTHNWSKVTIFNSVFTNNYAGYSDYIAGAAGLCLGHTGLSQINIINSTIAKNHTDGIAGGIGLWSNERLNIYNCVITGNTDRNGISDIASIEGMATPVVRMYNSVYQQVVSPITLSANINNFNNIAPNAVFVDYANNNFNLIAGSAAINSGSENSYVTQWNSAFPSNQITTSAQHVDIQGNNRWQSCDIDMGAFESPHKSYRTKPISDNICENKTYNFNGKILNEAGVYYDTVPSDVCDTIVKLTLTEIPTQHYHYRDTSYECEWYYFGGDSINAIGTYTLFDTLLTWQGCDSIITLDLLVRPREFDDTLNICADRLPITIYDTTFDRNIVNGTYIIRHRCATITLWVDIIPMTETHPPDIPKICADENSFILEFLPTNYQNTKPPTHYEIIFNNPPVPTGFEGFENQSDVFGNDNKITVYLPEKVYPDYYNCKVILKDDIYDCAPQVFDIKISVLYPDSIMKQKWDNVIALTNYYYNGGFEFAGYQWFKNGSILAGENNSYIYRPLAVGEKYSVLLTRPNGSQMFSCDFTVNEPSTEISPFPTLVSPNSTIKIPLQDKNATVRLITTTGVVLSTYKSDSEIIAPAQQGVYLLEILSSNNSRNVVKIVVK